MSVENATTWQDHEPIIAIYYEDAGSVGEPMAIGCRDAECAWRSSDDSYGYLGFADHLTKLPGMPDYMIEYWRTWAQYVEAPGGVNRDAVARELSDYGNVMRNASTVYSEIAGLSKPNTAPEYIIQASEERSAEHYADLLCDHAWDAKQNDEEALANALIEIADTWHPSAWDKFVQAKRLHEKFQAKLRDQPA